MGGGFETQSFHSTKEVSKGRQSGDKYPLVPSFHSTKEVSKVGAEPGDEDAPAPVSIPLRKFPRAEEKTPEAQQCHSFHSTKEVSKAGTDNRT